MSRMNLDYIINLMDGNFNRNMRAAQGQTSRLDSQFKKLAVTAAAAFSIQTAMRLVEESTQAAARLEALDVRLKTVSSSTEQYNEYAAAVADNVKKLKLPIEEATSAFGAFAASTRGSGLEGQKTIDIFRGFSTAGRGMKLSSAQMSSALTAIEQMMTKGQVRSQEMVLQLGNAMPGALNQAAKAIGVTKTEFSKMMEQGKVDAEKFLPIFAAHLENLYGPGVKDAVNSLQAKMVDLENQTLTTMAKIGKSTQGVYFAWLNIKLKLLNVLVYALQVYERNKTAIDAAAKATAIFAAVLITYSAAMRAGYVVTMLMVKAQTIYRAYTLASVVATGGFKAAWIALNTAFAISPIGAIITAIAALTVGLVIAYQKSESFRAAMDGLGETGVQALKLLRQQFMLLLAPMRIIATFWTEGPKAAYKMFAQLKQETLDYAKTAADVYSGAAFQRGRARSFEKSRAQTPGEDNALGALGSETAMSEALKNFGGGAGASGSGSSQSVAGGRSVRNVSVRIDKQLFDLKVYTTTAKESVNDIKRLVQDAINRAVLDSEAAL